MKLSFFGGFLIQRGIPLHIFVPILEKYCFHMGKMFKVLGIVAQHYGIQFLVTLRGSETCAALE